MMNLTDRATAMTIRNTFAALDVKMPKALTGAFSDAEKLNAKANDLGPGQDALEPAVAIAILTGREPSADPEVQRIVTAQALANLAVTNALTVHAGELVRVACTEQVAMIVATWRKAFDAAGDDLTAAHRRIGDLGLDDTTSILAKGADIAEVWASARKAASTIDTVVNGWMHLMTLTRAVKLDPRHRLLRITDASFEQWRALPAKVSPWDALRAGLTLSLPSAREYADRVAAVQAAVAEPETVVNTERSAIAGREIREPVSR